MSLIVRGECADYDGVVTTQKIQLTTPGLAGERAKVVRRRVKAIRAVRRSSEIEGARSTNETRRDQLAYAHGTIDVATLRDRVRRRYNLT